MLKDCIELSILMSSIDRVKNFDNSPFSCTFRAMHCCTWQVISFLQWRKYNRDCGLTLGAITPSIQPIKPLVSFQLFNAYTNDISFVFYILYDCMILTCPYRKAFDYEFLRSYLFQEDRLDHCSFVY